jgi:hypothetical protein
MLFHHPTIRSTIFSVLAGAVSMQAVNFSGPCTGDRQPASRDDTTYVSQTVLAKRPAEPHWP